MLFRPLGTSSAGVVETVTETGLARWHGDHSTDEKVPPSIPDTARGCGTRVQNYVLGLSSLGMTQ